MEVARDIQYREPDGCEPSLQQMDIYYRLPSHRTVQQPVVVFVHGGGWSAGDKASFAEPGACEVPRWFVDQGYVFVSVNFRLPGHVKSPRAEIGDMADDMAKAIKWLTISGRRYGGRRHGISLLGYSSGAHVAMLVATDPLYLGTYRLPLHTVSHVVGMDVPFYDVPLALQLMRTEDLKIPYQRERLEMMLKLMGTSRDAQTRWSPAAYLGPAVKDTRFLLLSTGIQFGQPQDFSFRMSAHFKELLDVHGITSFHTHYPAMDHGDMLNRFSTDLAGSVEVFLRDTLPS